MARWELLRNRLTAAQKVLLRGLLERTSGIRVVTSLLPTDAPLAAI